MIKNINGETYGKLILSGSNNLINSKNKIDALNVFPVPDGDTGTNMSSTVQAGVDYLKQNTSDNLSIVASAIAKNMLFGARGNSGVILSQIFKGFAIAFENKKEVDILGLLEGFRQATKKAYSSVLKPIEGTILTVIRETTENLEKIVTKETSLEEFFEHAVKFARKACDETPNKLKVLREVGVTDSGGEGLYAMIFGMNKFIHGEEVQISNEVDEVDKFISDSEVYDGEFGYCTEFILELNFETEFDKVNFEKSLQRKATSLVVVQDGELVKVHGHTLRPGDLLNFAQKYGEFAKIKSENMTKQANESRNKNVILNGSPEEMNECGIVSCNLGSGIIERMNEFGVDAIIESGQTQNPSAKDIIDAINVVNAKNVFILPNNSNIFLAAQQAAQTIKNKKVFIIPTKSQIQGISAMINFDKCAKAKDNEEILNSAIKLVTTGEVTKAIRNTKLNGVKIKEGHFIGISKSKIVSCEASYVEAAKKLIAVNVNKNTELITIYYGNEATKTDALELSEYIESNYNVEVEIVDGNQPTYHFLIGFE